MVGKVGEIWTEEFRLILDVLAELLKPGVPAGRGQGSRQWDLTTKERVETDIYQQLKNLTNR